MSLLCCGKVGRPRHGSAQAGDGRGLLQFPVGNRRPLRLSEKLTHFRSIYLAQLEMTKSEDEDTRRDLFERFLQKSLFHNLSDTEQQQILTTVNQEGASVLSTVVETGSSSILEFILPIVSPDDCNKRSCNLPLHISCLLGYSNSAQVLLSHGAVAKAMCSVDTKFLPETRRASLKGQALRNCELMLINRKIDAAHCAILGDSQPCLELVLNHGYPVSLQKDLLHTACSFDAIECVKFLLNVMKDSINCPNAKGDMPLMLALNGQCMELLVQAGATIPEAKLPHVLPEMYRAEQGPCRVFTATEYIASIQPKYITDFKDQDRNNLLHVFLHHFGRVGRFCMWDEIREILDCMRLLLGLGLDPLQKNRMGQTALDVLLFQPKYIFMSGDRGRVSRETNTQNILYLNKLFVLISEAVLLLLPYYKQNPHHCDLSPFFQVVSAQKGLGKTLIGVNKKLLHIFRLLLGTFDVNVCDSYNRTSLQLLLASHWHRDAIVNILCPMHSQLTELFMDALHHGLDLHAKLSSWHPMLQKSPTDEESVSYAIMVEKNTERNWCSAYVNIFLNLISLHDSSALSFFSTLLPQEGVGILATLMQQAVFEEIGHANINGKAMMIFLLHHLPRKMGRNALNMISTNTQLQRITQDHPHLVTLWENCIAAPWSLQALCRAEVLTNVGAQGKLVGLDHLPLPAKLINYLWSGDEVMQMKLEVEEERCDLAEEEE